MGFFNFLKNLKNGNFGLIARNITAIYIILKSEYISRFPDKKVLIGTSGIINALKYIKANQLETAEIIAMARPSANESSDSSDEVNDLTLFIGELQTAMFAVDTKLDYFK